MTDSKPFSQACENNKTPILQVLSNYLDEEKLKPGQDTLLEIGSGTGQHGAFMAAKLPHIVWQTSDLMENHHGIRQWIEEAQLPNLRDPLEFDVTQPAQKPSPHHHIFTANTLHIMSWPAVQQFFEVIPSILKTQGFAFFYGPFKYQGEFTSPSNQQFNEWLKQTDPNRAIRDFEAIEALASNAGLSLVEDVSMPANNQLLVFRLG